MATGEELMDVEQTVLPFSSYQLNSLASLTGVQNTAPVVESGLNTQFCNLIAKICGEISVLYGLDESVEEISDDGGIQGFLFDLSAFLGELECPHEIITCGPIEERFVSTGRRTFLFNYLISETKTARLFAQKSIEAPKTGGSGSLPPYVISALNTLKVPKPSGYLETVDVVKILTEHAEKKLQSVSQPTKPLFHPTSMDTERWKQVESVARALAQDCRSRHLLLLKRMDVTVNSFLWSDRVRKHEDRIRSFYSEKRDKISQLSAPGISGLISASDELLKIEQASSKKRREHTKSQLKPEGVNTAPADRGGRTDDIRGLRNETFQQQRSNENRGGGRGGFRGDRGGHRGGGYREHRGGGSDGGRGGGRGGFGHEQMVRQEYENRTGGGGHGNNDRGGHQRGGFRGGHRGGRGGGYNHNY